MGAALDGGDEARPHLHAGVAHRQRLGEAPLVAHAAGADDRHAEPVEAREHLARVELPGVAAGAAVDCDEAVDPGFALIATLGVPLKFRFEVPRLSTVKVIAALELPGRKLPNE